MLTAGTARAAITPPVGIPLSGFVGRGPATDVHDDLTVTVLVLAEDVYPDTAAAEARFAIVALDLIGLYSDELVAALKEAVRSASGIPPAHVFLTCSHTHYGPVVAERGDMPGGDAPQAAAYREQLTAVAADTVRAADGARVPVVASVGREAVRLGVNRRCPTVDGGIEIAPNPAGHVDPELIVARLNAVPSAGSPDAAPDTVATLVSYACHPSSLGDSVRSVSADFPGALRREVERRFGGHALFLQGAAGDIDPPDKRPDWLWAESLGLELAASALRAARSSVPIETSPLSMRRARVPLPRRGAASLPEAEAEVAAARETRVAMSPEDPARWWTELRLSEGEAVAEALRAGRAPTIDADVSALRVGDIAFAFVPAELFSALGVTIKHRSPARFTLVVGYTDGALWYVPTRAAFDEGGYEVVDACRVAAGAGEQLVEHTVALLEELFSVSR